MFDLVIKNAKEIDGSPFDIGIQAGKITAIQSNITEKSKKMLIIEPNQYLSAGWIDDHVHCFEEMSLYYDYPDEIGVKKGVTTVIDAGTTGANNIGKFYEYAKKAKTNVYALLNISKWGIIAQDELADLTKIQAELVKEKLKTYPDFIVGLKARLSRTVIGKNGIVPLQLAKKIQKENENLPLMIHIGSAPPNLEEILNLMDPGDILTHCFNGKDNGILDQKTKKIKPFVFHAYRQGILFDLGHGTDSFNFFVAETAFKEQLKVHSISSDIYIRNRQFGRVYDLATTVEKMHAIGYSWSEILTAVTKTPAKSFHLKQKGAIKLHFDADFTLFEFLKEPKMLIDSNGNQRIISEQMKPLKTIIGGNIYDCES